MTADLDTENQLIKIARFRALAADAVLMLSGELWSCN